jgi:transcription antitermination factor NusA-like protein
MLTTFTDLIEEHPSSYIIATMIASRDTEKLIEMAVREMMEGSMRKTCASQAGMTVNEPIARMTFNAHKHARAM